MTGRAGMFAFTVLAIGVILSCNGHASRQSVGERALDVDARVRELQAAQVVSLQRVELGRRLFGDVRLSRDSTLRCATCHMPTRAFSEPRELSHGIGLRAQKRNAPSLINVSLSRSSFDWDGRASNLEEQLRGVFASTGDMAIDLGEAVERLRSDRSYDAAFRRAYSRAPDVESFIGALVTFQQSLVLGDSRFDRFYLEGDSSALSTSEKRGWILFQRKSCAGCHVPFPVPEASYMGLFTDGSFHNLGVGYEGGRMADAGRYSVTRNPSEWGAFKTPSLRNVALTAPYMHDGSLPTLEDVVDFYAAGGSRNPNLDVAIGRRSFTRQERADLVAFLRTLTTEWLSDSVAVRKRFRQPPAASAEELSPSGQGSRRPE